MTGKTSIEAKSVASSDSTTEELGIERIQEMLPHRFPMVMIDRVENVVPNESAIGIKNVSINEWFFQGHFPEKPVMPGVLIIEAMAQTAAVLVVRTMGPDFEGKLVYFMSIEDARFRKPVVPGDTLRLHVTKQRQRANVWRFKAEAYVKESLVAEAGYTAMLMEE